MHTILWGRAMTLQPEGSHFEYCSYWSDVTRVPQAKRLLRPDQSPDPTERAPKGQSVKHELCPVLQREYDLRALPQ